MRSSTRLRRPVVSWGLAVALALPLPSLAQQLASLYRIRTVAGAGTVGDGGPAANAFILGPVGLEEDNFGAIYIAESEGARIRKIALNGEISTVVGTGVPLLRSPDGQFGPNTTVGTPAGLLLDRTNSTLYFSDFGDCRIRKILTGGGPVTTVIGTGECAAGPDSPTGNRTAILNPMGMTADLSGRIVYAEWGSHRVRRIIGARVETIAGTGKRGFLGDGRQAREAELENPSSVAYDGRGNLYIAVMGADMHHCHIRMVAPDGLISTFAGNGECTVNSQNLGDFGPAQKAAIGPVMDVKWDKDKNRLVFVSRSGHLRAIHLDTGLIRTLAGNGSNGFSETTIPEQRPLNSPSGVLPSYRYGFVISDTSGFRVLTLLDRIALLGGMLPTADTGLPPLQATVLKPAGVGFDAAGRTLIVDEAAHRIRRLEPGGTITTVVGAPTPGCCAGGDGGPAASALLNGPTRVVRDRAGNLYIADSFNNRVRKVDAAGSISTLFTAAGSVPHGLALDAEARNLFWSDPFRHRVMRYEFSSGINSVFAGTGEPGRGGDGGLQGLAQLAFPRDLALDSKGNLYIADYLNQRVRKVSQGVISTVAGGGPTAVTVGATPALQVNLGNPDGLALDRDDNLLISTPQRILAYTPGNGQVVLVAGTGAVGFDGDGGFSTQAKVAGAQGLGMAEDGTIYFADTFNHRIRALTPVRSVALTPVSGNNQEGQVGRPLPVQLTVQVRADGAPMPNVAVSFVVTAGSASATPTQATTNAEGNASTSVTLGNTPGTVTIEARALGAAPAVFTLQSVAAPGGGGGGGGGGGTPAGIPKVNTVITAGSFGGQAEIATGSWIEIYGTNFATAAREWTGADFTGNQAPTRLDNVRVTFNGRAGFVRYVSQTQVNVQAPDGLAPGEVTVLVINASGTSEAFKIQLVARSPGLLAPAAFKAGADQFAAALFLDGVTFVGREGLIAGVPFRPAEAGERVMLFGVGFGATSPTIPAGQVVGRTANLPNVIVTLGGVRVTVEYAGLAPGAIGLYQFNLVIPEGLSGDQPLEISVAGVALKQRLLLTLK